MSAVSDAGGVAARHGFKYQDHVAAYFALEMIANPNLLRVECETADDILLLWKSDPVDHLEYVQVKTTESDKKWSSEEICKRSVKERPTSLAEKSLLCDCHGPDALFRIVSRRAVNKNLSCLTIPLYTREGNTDVATLAAKLGKKYKKTISPKGHDLIYWTNHLFWQVTGDVNALLACNLQTLSLLADQYGANPTHRHLHEIYEKLLSIVDKAALASRVKAPNEKVIDRGAILTWWECQLGETRAAALRTSKPYRIRRDDFFVELHHITEASIKRALTGYDVQYDLDGWRSAQLASYLADWLPEVTLKASELAGVDHTNLQHKLHCAIRQIERHRAISIDRLLAEILLHAVIRHYFHSEPIACKLFYQSINGTKSFGSAHIVHGDKRDELWLGRATIADAASYDVVAASVIAGLVDILDPEFLRDEREIIVTLREPQHLIPTSLERILQHNTPVSALLEVLCIPILIAYESPVLAKGFSEDYVAHIVAEITERYQNIKPLLPTTLAKVKVHVFFIPIECLTTLTKDFSERIEGH